MNPEAGSGWQVNVVKAPLPKPITTDDGTFTSTVERDRLDGSTIPVGQFGEFNVLAQGIPSGTSQLVFKAIQTYSDGTVVSWIEVPDKAVPDPEHPAPMITLTAAGKDGAASTATTTPAATAASSSTGSTSSGSNAWEIAALILAGLALVVSVLAVWLGGPASARPTKISSGRRRRAAPPDRGRPPRSRGAPWRPVGRAPAGAAWS